MLSGPKRYGRSPVATGICRGVGCLTLAALCFYFATSGHSAAFSRSPRRAVNKEWVLTWHDEFNGPNGAPPDKAKWLIETGGNGWGNHELQYDTARPQNVRQEGGNLVIEAVKQPFTGPDGIERDYTSGRLNTSRRLNQTYGRFEARIKNPRGAGLWPAFWLLGDNFHGVGWPTCGEIDIMEQRGGSGSGIWGSAHGPGYSGADALASSYQLPSGDFSDAFHLFALEWEPKVLRFYVDGHLYATVTPSDLPAGRAWVFDRPFYIVLSLAVRADAHTGGGAPDSFPQKMLVDYVRVYARK